MTGVLDYMNNPANQGLLSLASGMLQAGGPQRFPVSFGQALGQGADQGMASYNHARQLNEQAAMRDAQVQHMGMQNQLIEQQVAKAKGDAALSAQMSGGAFGQMTPDQLDMLGQRLAIGGHPGAATVMTIADKRRQQKLDGSSLDAMRSTPDTPGVLGAGVTTASPQGQGLLSQAMTGDKEFDQAALAGMNEGLNSNARPGMLAQPVTPPVAGAPGLMGPLMASPHVGPAATQMQGLINARGIQPKDAIARFEQLASLHATQAGAQAGRDQSENTRRDLAENNDALRRELAASRPPAAVTSVTIADPANPSRSIVVDGRTGRKIGDAPATKQVHPMADKLFKEYAANPQVKEANELEVKFKPVLQYVNDLNSGRIKSSINERDAEIAKMYLAVTSTVGSRAYNMDKKELSAMPNLADRLGNMASSFFAGKDLTDKTRKEMVSVISSRFTALNDARKATKAMTLDRARRNMVPEDQIFGER